MVPNREWEVTMRNGGSYRIVQAMGDYTVRLGLRRFGFKVRGSAPSHSPVVFATVNYFASPTSRWHENPNHLKLDHLTGG